MRGYVYILIGAISYGMLSSIVKIAYQAGYQPSDVTTVQMTLGCIILWLLVLVNFIYHKFVKRKDIFGKLSKKDILLLLSVGSVTGLTGIFYYITLTYINASLAIILLFQFTWMSMILEFLILKTKPSKGKIISLVPLLIGTVFATNIIGNQIDINPLGIIFGLLSALSYSIFILVSGKIAPKSNPFKKSALMVSGGLVVTLIAFQPAIILDAPKFMALTLDSGLLLALFGPVISTVMFAKGTPLIGPAMSALLGAMELPTVIVASAIMLHEQVSVIQVVGVILILIAIALPQILDKIKPYKYV